MTRLKIKYKKPKRTLSPLQKLLVAKDIVRGDRGLKQVAHDWRISRAAVNRIFADHLEYRIVWQAGKEPRPRQHGLTEGDLADAMCSGAGR